MCKPRRVDVQSQVRMMARVRRRQYRIPDHTARSFAQDAKTVGEIDSSKVKKVCWHRARSLHQCQCDSPQHDAVALSCPGPCGCRHARRMEKLCLTVSTSPFAIQVVFVDSTWAQTHKIVTDPRLSKLPHVKIAQVDTLFWRYAKATDHAALYVIFRDLMLGS